MRRLAVYRESFISADEGVYECYQSGFLMEGGADLNGLRASGRGGWVFEWRSSARYGELEPAGAGCGGC